MRLLSLLPLVGLAACGGDPRAGDIALAAAERIGVAMQLYDTSSRYPVDQGTNVRLTLPGDDVTVVRLTVDGGGTCAPSGDCDAELRAALAYATARAAEARAILDVFAACGLRVFANDGLEGANLGTRDAFVAGFVWVDAALDPARVRACAADLAARRRSLPWAGMPADYQFSFYDFPDTAAAPPLLATWPDHLRATMRDIGMRPYTNFAARIADGRAILRPPETITPSG